MSRGDSEYPFQFWRWLTMIKSIRQNAKHQCLYFVNRLLL